jgi:D-alanyl-D-alanine dipeptidase
MAVSLRASAPMRRRSPRGSVGSNLRCWMLTASVYTFLLALPNLAAAIGLPAAFVFLHDIDPTILQDIRYAGTRNFIGRPLAGYLAAECILERQTALALRAVQERIKPRFSLKVFDCYRPKSAVRDLMKWATIPADAQMKLEFYPAVDKSELFDRGFIASRSKHSQGTAVDVALVDNNMPLLIASSVTQQGSCAGPFPERFPDTNLDFGTNFDCFDESSETLSKKVPREATSNRRILLREMQRAGFINYSKEWWHFERPTSERDEFDFAISTHERNPKANATVPATDRPMNTFETCGTHAAIRIVCLGSANGVGIHSGPSSTFAKRGTLYPADGTVNCVRCAGTMSLSTFAALGALAKSDHRAPWCEIRQEARTLGWLDARFLAPIDQMDVECEGPAR